MFKKLRSFVHRHTHQVNVAEHAGHLLYLGAVTFGGPYNLVAGGLLVIGILALILHLEE